MMKAVTLVLSVLIGLFSLSRSAVAQELPATWVDVEQRVSFFSINSFYSCDIAEYRARDILSQMGADDIQVDCRGGLPDWDQVWLYLDYKTLKSTTEDKATTKGKTRNVALTVDSECNLQETIIRQVARKFEATQTKKSGFCDNGQGRLRYEFNVFTKL